MHHVSQKKKKIVVCRRHENYYSLENISLNFFFFLVFSYHDNRVFVALANGDVTVYARDKSGGWNTTEPESVAVGTAAASVTKMIPAGGRLWCGCHNMIRILKITPLEVEVGFQVFLLLLVFFTDFILEIVSCESGSWTYCQWIGGC